MTNCILMTEGSETRVDYFIFSEKEQVIERYLKIPSALEERLTFRVANLKLRGYKIENISKNNDSTYSINALKIITRSRLLGNLGKEECNH